MVSAGFLNSLRVFGRSFSPRIASIAKAAPPLGSGYAKVERLSDILAALLIISFN
jgi:hypothetical protein